MRSSAVVENLVAATAERCRAGLDPESLRAEVLPRLRRAVPVDALWWATVDPSTLLFGQAYREEIPAAVGPYFVQNEFLTDDVNKWTSLARDSEGVRTLVAVTDGDPGRSARYRDIFRPLGLEDELRAVLRTRGITWGLMCLHREAGSAFSAAETAIVRRLAPHIADALRFGALLRRVGDHGAAAAPGLIVLTPDGALVSANDGAGAWLEELGATVGSDLPIEVHAVATMLRRHGAGDAGLPRLRVRTRAGPWATLTASWLSGAGGRVDVAVIIEPASAAEVAPIVMGAYGLTAVETEITALACRGLSTREIAGRRRITEHTVQDHLKRVFAKTGVRSRRELVVAILRDRHALTPSSGTNESRGGEGLQSPPPRI